MSWIEWGVLAAGLALGYGVVSMLMGERRARARREDGPKQGQAHGQEHGQKGGHGDGPADSPG